MRRQSILSMAAVIVLSTTLPGFADLSDGLVAYYPFTWNANDASGENHGTVYGASWTSTGAIAASNVKPLCGGLHFPSDGAGASFRNTQFSPRTRRLQGSAKRWALWPLSRTNRCARSAACGRGVVDDNHLCDEMSPPINRRLPLVSIPGFHCVVAFQRRLRQA
jgi:hypothetical protein